MKDVVWIIDPETFTFRYVSPSVGKLLGYSQEEFIAMPLAANMPRKEAERVHSIVRERMKAFLESGGEKEAFYTDEILETRKDGSRVWTEIVTKYYLDTVRGKPEIQGVSRDISERKKAEAASRSLWKRRMFS
jgi:PAS domain S-box-containing protein